MLAVAWIGSASVVFAERWFFCIIPFISNAFMSIIPFNLMIFFISDRLIVFLVNSSLRLFSVCLRSFNVFCKSGTEISFKLLSIVGINLSALVI